MLKLTKKVGTLKLDKMLLGLIKKRVYCLLNSYFTFITKGKLQFSLVCSFSCCLVKGD